MAERQTSKLLRSSKVNNHSVAQVVVSQSQVEINLVQLSFLLMVVVKRILMEDHHLKIMKEVAETAMEAADIVATIMAVVATRDINVLR